MSSLDRRTLLLGAGASLGLARCGRSESHVVPSSSGKAARLIAAARSQIGVTTRYDPAYSVIPFPRGDVPRGRGTCTDVVIRAYRDALGLDLQALVNADMRAAFAAYPHGWGLKGPDRNIDHRRSRTSRHGSAATAPRFPFRRTGPAGGPATSSPRSSAARAPISASSRTGAGGPGGRSSTISAPERARRTLSSPGRSPAATAGRSTELSRRHPSRAKGCR